jgi:hypothetical protein
MAVDWTKIHSTTFSWKAEIIKGTLQENDIPCVVINKQDSMYKPIGELEIYVPRDMVLKALHLLEKEPEDPEEEDWGELAN